MNFSDSQEQLRQILENLRNPGQLDAHPWASSLFVKEAVAQDASLALQSPGHQLAQACLRQFQSLMPSNPPKRGKRLDTRWGEFGILASQYFAPFAFGLPAPLSLREAWGKIDQAILWFVFQKPLSALDESDRERYKLVGDELETAANSTISDWHRNGILHLAELIAGREAHLERDPSSISTPQTSPPPAQSSRPRLSTATKKKLLIGVVILLVLGLLFTGYKAWQDINLVLDIRGEVSQLQGLTSKPNLQNIGQAAPIIVKLHADLSQLRSDINLPLKAAGSLLGWLPVYGPDIAASPDLLEMSDESSAAAQTALLATAPLLDSLQAGSFSPADAAKMMIQASPQLEEARQSVALARAARARVNASGLSPRVSALLNKIDPLLGGMDDGLTLLTSLPKLLGASDAGPQTYLLLVQNEDELRATGGFITSVGSFVVRDGDIFGLKFQQSEEFEDRTKPYPPAPWQQNEYMNMPAIFLRDGNWSPNFPSTAALVEYLYAYETGHSVDGIIAIDQHSLVLLLKAIGPLKLPDVPDPITADNVVEYMRQAKLPPENTPAGSWDRKAFIGNMASALLAKLRSGKGFDAANLFHIIMQALDQRHILLQLDDQDIGPLLVRHAWDGAVRPGSADFLMTVDTNIGFNKTSSVVNEKLSYDVDLTNLAQPKSSLAVFHENLAQEVGYCGSFYGAPKNPIDSFYPINRCYYDYFRIYLPANSQLIQATPHAIPGDWLMLGQPVPARVDELRPDFEKIDNVVGFGSLLVVPERKSLNTSFEFSLPASIITTQGSQRVYALHIQKQPGTLGTPITLRIHLPNNAGNIQVEGADATLSANNLLLETDLTTDIHLTVRFSVP